MSAVEPFPYSKKQKYVRSEANATNHWEEY